MRTLDQIGAEILAAVSTAMADVKHAYVTVMVHDVPEECLTSGEMRTTHDNEVYFRQQHLPTDNIYPSVTFFSQSRPPSEAEYAATKNTEPITGEELPF
jgi:hypothetical protein